MGGCAERSDVRGPRPDRSRSHRGPCRPSPLAGLGNCPSLGRTGFGPAPRSARSQLAPRRAAPGRSERCRRGRRQRLLQRGVALRARRTPGHAPVLRRGPARHPVRLPVARSRDRHDPSRIAGRKRRVEGLLHAPTAGAGVYGIGLPLDLRGFALSRSSRPTRSRGAQGSQDGADHCFVRSWTTGGAPSSFRARRRSSCASSEGRSPPRSASRSAVTASSGRPVRIRSRVQSA